MKLCTILSNYKRDQNKFAFNLTRWLLLTQSSVQQQIGGYFQIKMTRYIGATERSTIVHLNPYR